MSKCVTESSKLVKTARASGSTIALSVLTPANLRIASMDSQRVSTTNSTVSPAVRRSRYAPRCPSIACRDGKTFLVACCTYSSALSTVERARHIRKIISLIFSLSRDEGPSVPWVEGSLSVALPCGRDIRPNGYRSVFPRHRRPLPDIPSLHCPARHIGINLGKLLGYLGRVAPEQEHSAVYWVRQRTTQ